MSRNSKLLLILVAAGIGMFGFGFANIPLFKMFCSAVGIQISSPKDLTPGAAGTQIDKTRSIKVLFTTAVNDNLPILFESDKSLSNVNPGALDEVNYRFVNLSDDTLYFRPVHSIFPAEANKKYDMIKCFCFQDMVLQPREEVTHILVYSFHDDLDPAVSRVTMHYTLFKRDPTAADWGRIDKPEGR